MQGLALGLLNLMRFAWAHPVCVGSKGSAAGRAVLARAQAAPQGGHSSAPLGPGETVPGHSVRARAGRVQADTGHRERMKVGSLPTEERETRTLSTELDLAQIGIGEKASQVFI